MNSSSVVFGATGVLALATQCGEPFSAAGPVSSPDHVDSAGETAAYPPYSNTPKWKPTTSLDAARIPAKMVASARLSGERRAVLSLAKEEVRFADDGKIIESYMAVIALNLISKSGKDEEIWTITLRQRPLPEPPPSEPHDFRLTVTPDELLGVAFADNGFTIFAEVDPRFVKEFPPIRGEDQIDGLVWQGENYCAEMFFADKYLPVTGYGNRMYSDITVESVAWENGTWFVTVNFEGRSQQLRRNSVGNWEAVTP